MSQVKQVYADPIEQVVYDVGDRISGAFYKTHHTPNTITTYSVIFKVLSVVALWYGQYFTFCTTYFVSYMFDCFDGLMARKYKMYSTFGDMYDHITDNLTFAAIIIIVCMRLWHVKRLLAWCVVLIGLLGLLNVSYLGCLTKHRAASVPVGADAGQQSVLSNLQQFCVEANFVGTGFFSLLMPIIITICMRKAA